jgi:hypothetical protein
MPSSDELVDNYRAVHIVMQNQSSFRWGLPTMIEILILISMCRRIGERAREKGRTAGKYQFMLVLFWFGGEIGGAFLTSLILTVVYGEDFEKFMFIAYIAAIVGAIFAAWLAFRIVASIPEPVIDEDQWSDE